MATSSKSAVSITFRELRWLLEEVAATEYYTEERVAVQQVRTPKRSLWAGMPMPRRSDLISSLVTCAELLISSVNNSNSTLSLLKRTDAKYELVHSAKALFELLSISLC
jgi:hypothetical protein